MKYLDLFSGIGGFAYAIDQVFYEEENEHIFVENDPFCQAVLRKHWPRAEIHGDIQTFGLNTNSNGNRRTNGKKKINTTKAGKQTFNDASGCDRTFILTGGFPCQPFSQAGRRRGTADDRYLWPPMLDVVGLFRPEWVIAENVAGLVTWNDGMVLATVVSDLEKEGYEVQSFIIPAVAIGAPHRRDRVWIVANRTSGRKWGSKPEGSRSGQSEKTIGNGDSNAYYAKRQRLEGQRDDDSTTKQGKTQQTNDGSTSGSFWREKWQEVALATCNDGMDDGLPRRMDGVTISAARHRRERLKACGNAIVPQVAMQILQAIKEVKSPH